MSLRERFGRFVVTLVIVGFIKGVHFSGQWLWHIGGREKLRAFETQMAAKEALLDKEDSWFQEEREALDKLERQIEGKESEIAILKSEMLRNRARITSLEKAQSRGVPSSTPVRYREALAANDRLLLQHRQKLKEEQRVMAAFKRKADVFDARVQLTNAKVAAYNAELKEGEARADEVLGTWELTPVPTLAPSSRPAVFSRRATLP